MNALRWKVIALVQRHPLRAVAVALAVGGAIASILR